MVEVTNTRVAVFPENPELEAVESVFVDGTYTVALSQHVAKIGFYQDIPGGASPSVRRARLLLVMARGDFEELADALVAIRSRAEENVVAVTGDAG